MSDRRSEFCKELLLLLEKYQCHIEAKDHFYGYAGCGEDIRITVEFDDWSIKDIDLTDRLYFDSFIAL